MHTAALQATATEHPNRHLHGTSPSSQLCHLQETQKSCPAGRDAIFQTEFLCPEMGQWLQPKTLPSCLHEVGSMSPTYSHSWGGKYQEILQFENSMIRILRFQPLLLRLGPLGSWWQLTAFEGCSCSLLLTWLLNQYTITIHGWTVCFARYSSISF